MASSSRIVSGTYPILSRPSLRRDADLVSVTGSGSRRSHTGSRVFKDVNSFSTRILRDPVNRRTCTSTTARAFRDSPSALPPSLCSVALEAGSACRSNGPPDFLRCGFLGTSEKGKTWVWKLITYSAWAEGQTGRSEGVRRGERTRGRCAVLQTRVGGAGRCHGIVTAHASIHVMSSSSTDDRWRRLTAPT